MKYKDIIKGLDTLRSIKPMWPEDTKLGKDLRKVIDLMEREKVIRETQIDKAIHERVVLNIGKGNGN